MNIKRLSVNSFLLNFPYLVSFLLRFITLPIVLRTISPLEYGKLQFVFALQEWSVAFTANNITAGMKRGLAKGLNGTFIFAFLYRLLFLLIIFICLMLTSWIIYIFLNKPLLAKLLSIVAFFLISGYIFQTALFEFFIAKKYFLQWSIWKVIISSISIVGSALIAYFTKNVLKFVMFQVGSITLLSLIGLVYIIKKYNLLTSYRKGEIDRECLPYGMRLIFADLVSLTANRISHFIIGPFFGFSNLAVFSIAERLRRRFFEIIWNFRALFYSDFANLDREEMAYKIKKRLFILGIVSLMFSFLLMLIGVGYIKYFLPNTYRKAIVYFSILSLSFPAGMISVIFQTMLEAHLCHKEFSTAKIVSDVIKTFLILSLGYLWKVVGVCIAITVGIWIYLFIFYLVSFKKNHNYEKS